MALENQPIYQAPSLPKMGKASSPLMRGAKGVSAVTGKPKLKASRMSFIRAKKAESIQADQLRGTETVSTKSIAVTLTETNRILVEIQKQLALDFANRIAEKNAIINLSKKQVRKTKLVAKEDYVERGKGLAGNIKEFGKNVLSPVKGIFDKILEFLTLVGAGIALNAAFEWLSDKENREKLVRVFNFLRDHWKTLLAIVIGGKILSLLLKLKSLFSLAGSLAKRLKDLFGKNGKFKPGSEDFCRAVVACVLSKIPVIIGSLLASALFINALKPKLGIPDNPTTPSTPAPPTPVPVQPQPPAPVLPGETVAPVEPEKPVFNIQELLRRPSGKYTPAESQFLIDQGYDDFVKGGQTQAPGVDLAAITALFAAVKTAPIWGPALLTQVGRLRGLFGRTPTPAASRAVGSSGPKIDVSKVDPSRLSQSATTGVGQGASTVAKKMDFRGLANREFNTLNKINPSQSSLKTEVSNLLDQAARGTLRPADQSKLNAIRSYAEKKGYGDIVARLREMGIQSIEQMRKAATGATKTPGLSKGGTVFGQGSQSVDSVPAMLAPGEEVIRSSSANLFRPVLKDINDNAGRLFTAFRTGVERQESNNRLQAEETNRSISLLTGFSDLIEKRIRKFELEELKKRMGFMDLLYRPDSETEESTTTSLVAYTPSVSQSNENLLASATTPLEPSVVRLQVVPFDTSKLNTYAHRRSNTSSDAGSVETMQVDMPATVINAQRPQPQAQPEEQPRESSSPNINISTMDADNPYILKSLAAYGVEM